MEKLDFDIKSLNQKVDESFRAVQTNKEHMLLPIFRSNIYTEMSVTPLLKNCRQWLDFLTMERILHLWSPILQDEIWKDYYHVPSKMISLLKKLLNGNIDRSIVASDVNHWVEVTDLTGELSNSMYYHAFCVFDAGVAALTHALNDDYFPVATLSESSTDEDLSGSESDTAKWAAIAGAGGIWIPDYSEEKEYGRVVGTWNRNLSEVRTRRKMFWEWWLLEAIPKAIQLSQE